MAPTRVLQIATRLAVGGAQKHMLDLCRNLPRDRYEVEVLAGPEVGSDGDLQPEFAAAGIPVQILPGLHRDENLASDLTALWRMVGAIRRGRYQVVHTHMAKAGVIGRLAAGFAHVPVIVHTVHGWPWHNFLDRKTKERYVDFERRAARKSDRIIVTSERDRGKGLAHHVAAPNKYELIRAGVDLERYDPAKYDRAFCRAALGLPEKAPVVVTVAALTEQKNPLEAIEVIHRARHSFSDLHYLMVGDGPLRAACEAKVAELEIVPFVHFLGLTERVPEALAAADVFLLTSRWEGLPRTLLEAMAMGKAVVATQVDGVLDVIEDNVTGYARDPGDIDELTAMVVRLFRAPNLIAEMHRGNTAWLRRPEFDLKTSARRVDQLYQQLLRGKGVA